MQRERKLEEARKRDLEHQAAQHKESLFMKTSLALSSATAVTGDLLQQFVLGKWRELALQQRLEAGWKTEFEAEQKRLIEDQRIRSSALAFAVSSKQAQDSQFLSQRLLLQTVWSALCEHVSAVKRDRDLDLQQRLYEDEQCKLREEAKHLDSKHHSLHMRRKFVFLLQLEDRDVRLALQLTWSAWRECLQLESVEALRHRLEEAELAGSLAKQALGAELAEIQNELRRARTHQRRQAEAAEVARLEQLEQARLEQLEQLEQLEREHAARCCCVRLLELWRPALHRAAGRCLPACCRGSVRVCPGGGHGDEGGDTSKLKGGRAEGTEDAEKNKSKRKYDNTDASKDDIKRDRDKKTKKSKKKKSKKRDSAEVDVACDAENADDADDVMLADLLGQE